MPNSSHVDEGGLRITSLRTHGTAAQNTVARALFTDPEEEFL
jgi:hypothetical protein